MNAETFCEHFATFADAPNGIAKLRELILQTAMLGKLVCDGVPCSDWTAKKLDELVDPEFPISYGVLKPGPHIPDGIPLVKSQHIRDWKVSEQIEERVSRELDSQFRRTKIKGGEILLNLVGASIGRCAIAPKTLCGANVSRAVAVITLQANVDAEFVLIMLTAVFTQSWINSTCSGSAQPVFNLGDLRKVEIPFPSLAEQRRVVAKVYQLLGLCDELAARQVAQREKRQRLVGATLDRLVSTRNPAEFTAHAHRLRNHFDQLFDTPTTIPQLRQTILQLAVQGQLVPQDPNDESASQLLLKIKAERLRLITEKKISKSEPTSPVDESQMLFSIPETWSWVRLPDVCHVITDGEHLTPQYAEAGIPMLSAKHVGSHSLLLEDFKLVSHATAAKCWSRCCPDERDILVVSRGGGVGRTIISGRRDYCLMGSVLLFKLASQVDERFLCHFLNSTQGNEKLRTTSGASAQQAIYIAHLKRDYVVPLPPLAEQKRIVTKVTELLSLCDALEAKLTQAESASTQLLSAAVHQLLNGAVGNV